MKYSKSKPVLKYRGAKPAMLVRVCEGNGTDEYPYEEVDYVVVYENDVPKTIGRVTQTEDFPKNP